MVIFLYRIETKDFSLTDTLECGQCFRWNPINENTYAGIYRSNFAEISQSGDVLVIKGFDESSKDEIIHYLGVDNDYSNIKQILKQDEILEKAIALTPGIRIMNQPFFETLISFIISQNNNIPRIKKIIETLCLNFGEPINGGYTFPTAEKLASLETSNFSVTHCGFRDKYIIDAARKCASGEINSDKFENLDTPSVICNLCSIKGVGPKVAGCVALFSLGRYDAFPVDTWIKKIMARCYPEGLPSYALPYAGIAQQYLFCYARNEF